jgi:predicted permease
MTKEDKQNSLIECLRKIFVPIEIFELNLEKIEARLTPLEKIIYGGISIILVTVLGAILGWVIVKR